MEIVRKLQNGEKGEFYYKNGELNICHYYIDGKEFDK